MTAAQLLANLIAAIDDLEPTDRLSSLTDADAGCIDCTRGTVPNTKNRGLCAYHSAVRYLVGHRELFVALENAREAFADMEAAAVVMNMPKWRAKAALAKQACDETLAKNLDATEAVR